MRWSFDPLARSAAVLLLASPGLADDAWSVSPSRLLQADAAPELVSSEEYPVYDRIVESKFLTDETRLVMINRMTVTRLGQEEERDNRRFLEENEVFEGRIEPALLENFLEKLGRSALLERRFNFGAAYRLISPGDPDDLDTSIMLHPAGFSQRDLRRCPPACRRPESADYTGGMLTLEFSRVAFTSSRTRALVYVGHYRADGSGAGFLFLLHPNGRGWTVSDTEVIWVVRADR
jgi:hypothetical protein